MLGYVLGSDGHVSSTLSCTPAPQVRGRGGGVENHQSRSRASRLAVLRQLRPGSQPAVRERAGAGEWGVWGLSGCLWWLVCRCGEVLACCPCMGLRL